jgi:hypothetical protein
VNRCCILLLAFALQGPAQALFEFHNEFWINLHQFLYDQATSAKPVESESPDWRNAVDYYRREMVRHDLLSNEAAAVNNRLSAAGSAAELPAAGLDPALVTVLAKAAPVYRRDWWPRHERSNRAWIDAVTPLLARDGAAIRKDLTALYHVDWPATPVRTDVAAHAGANGAYTTNDPAHITINSTSPEYQGVASLEMLFHEASHTLNDKLRAVLSNELGSARLFRRRGLDHAILFYMAGEITRRYVAGYEPFGVRYGVLERGWPGSLPVLEKDWKPYLEGRIDLESAAKAVVQDYGVDRGK